MKKIGLFLLVLIASTSISAQIYQVDSSYVHFFSEAPLENIEAHNNHAKGLINSAKNEVAFVVAIKSFEFEKELMKEHFNENYMESDQYKNGLFKGKINETIDWKKGGKYEVSVTGTLTIHGVAKPRTIKGTLVVSKNRIHVQSKFKVKLEDHKIEIPTVVFQNIAEVIDVTTDLRFSPKK